MHFTFIWRTEVIKYAKHKLEDVELIQISMKINERWENRVKICKMKENKREGRKVEMIEKAIAILKDKWYALIVLYSHSLIYE